MTEWPLNKPLRDKERKDLAAVAELAYCQGIPSERVVGEGLGRALATIRADRIALRRLKKLALTDRHCETTGVDVTDESAYKDCGQCVPCAIARAVRGEKCPHCGERHCMRHLFGD